MGNLFAQYFGLTEITSIESKCVRTGYQMFTLMAASSRHVSRLPTKLKRMQHATPHRNECFACCIEGRNENDTVFMKL